MTTSVLGIHHVTAICSDPQRNLDFYGGLLGQRLVKRTVNFDDPQTYHFYYGDGVGSPGTILTFFPWPGARRGRQGAGQVAVTSYLVPSSAIGFWIERLLRHGVAFQGPTKRVFGGTVEQVLLFRDPDGLMIELVGHPSAAGRVGWEGAHDIPAADAIRGFFGVTLWVESHAATERVLTETLGFHRVGEAGSTRRFGVEPSGAAPLVDLQAVGEFVAGMGGAGTVHHVAWRAGSDESELQIRAAVQRAGLGPTPVIDRSYFHSVYFREPGGVLFELATDGPGFAIDEPVEQLGQALKLPPQFEPARAQIEAALPRIVLPVPNATAPSFAAVDGPEEVSGDALGFVHRYLPGTDAGERTGPITLLLLHGTGGDENDLIDLGRVLAPGTALLSPRGKVLERGMPRFFRRLAEGVFDQADLEKRTHELADFIVAASATYGFRVDRVIAVGFSNGANIAASMLLRRPESLFGAILLSPMVPFEPDPLPALPATPVFIGAGRSDPIAQPALVDRLATMLGQAGADVTIHWERGGHELAPGAVEAARSWLVGLAARQR